MFSSEQDPYLPLVRRIMNVDEVTWGEKKDFLVRYRGWINREDTDIAYDELAAALRPLGITPLFRMHEKKHSVLLLEGLIQTKPSNPAWNLVMFALTLVSVLLAGTLYSYGPVPENASFWQVIGLMVGSIQLGIPFAASLLGILVTHEFGHYLAARFHKTMVTLPYFIPLPLSPLGTMGAFIRIQEPPKNRRVMLDIGLAGPLAGLVVAVPIVIYGLLTSEVHTLPTIATPGSGFSLEGNSLLYLFLKFITKGELLPAPVSYLGLHPILYWARYLFTSTPLPFGGRDVMMNSVAWAGWAGLLVTALNLIPAGQLDGGHVMYVLTGRKAARLWPFIVGALALLGLFWSGWWLWALLIFWMGRVYMEPLDQITPLDTKRVLLALLGIAVFIIVFIPVPLVEIRNGF
jgi:membrane-associated protease RseP (regulator of RpoE activity)